MIKHHIKEMHGIKMIREHDAIFEDAERTGGVFEPESVAFWLKHCKPGHAAFDVGSYTGLFAILADKSGCHSYGFEPNMAVRERALENVALNESSAQILDIAISDKKGEENFYYSVHGLSSVGSFTQHVDANYFVRKVETMSLDYHFMLDFPICAIKMDTEGYEKEVLIGAVNILRKWKPALIIELNTMDEIREHSDFLKPFGYTYFERIDNRNLVCE